MEDKAMSIKNDSLRVKMMRYSHLDGKEKCSIVFGKLTDEERVELRQLFKELREEALRDQSQFGRYMHLVLQLLSKDEIPVYEVTIRED